MMLSKAMQRFLDVDLATASGRALIEERYLSLRRQVPVIYLLGFVNLSGMELATAGRLALGFNLPSLIAICGIVRLLYWYSIGDQATHEQMVRRMQQTVWFAAIICFAVCARCLYLFHVGDSASHMAVMLFGGLTAIGVAYGLTALPIAGQIPLLFIIVPLSIASILSGDSQFAWAAFGLVVVAALTMKLVTLHSRHLGDLIRSRELIAHQQLLAEHAHQEAAVAATTDFLTGLPNRRAFVATLEAEIDRTSAKQPFALALLDLNRFKAVNDTFGHETGDRLLQEIAARLVRATGPLGLVARLGGDEFGIFLPGVCQTEKAHAVGTSILREVNRPMTIEGRQFDVSVCCGFALSKSGEDRSPSRVMADADLALYQAKEGAPDHLAVFELQMEAPRLRRLQIERALQTDGVEKDLSLAFQPIVDLKSGRIIALEALARWTDGELGQVAPSEFVPIAEKLGMIERLNRNLLALAFNEARHWPDEIRLSFNLSALELCSAGFGEIILAQLAVAGLGTSRLQVEVTETALLADFETARSNLERLRRAGVTIVLDDFGAGYASIGYLRELRFDQIKLDGSLVTAAQDSADGKRLLRAVIGLCDLLGVASVAEHIESETLLTLLADLGCEAGQGFWLQRPMSGSEVREKVGDPAKWAIVSSRRHARHAA
jgi:diguanylate cyclase (GGDEF)-like protein